MRPWVTDDTVIQGEFYPGKAKEVNAIAKIVALLRALADIVDGAIGTRTLNKESVYSRVYISSGQGN
jgi:hypothetical protein